MPNAKKSMIQQSEFWLSLIASLLAIVMIFFKDEQAMAIASGIALTISAAVYAAFRTPLPSEKPGWKTKTFWVSILTVFGSVAAAIDEVEMPGLPKGVTRIAAMVTAGLTAGGYTIYRYKGKLALSKKGSPS